MNFKSKIDCDNLLMIGNDKISKHSICGLNNQLLGVSNELA